MDSSKSNIFDETSKKFRGQRGLKSPLSEKTKQQSTDSLSIDEIRRNEIQDMIKKMKEINSDIDKKLDEIFQKTGWDMRTIKRHLDNPDNYSKGQWERLQEKRKTQYNKLWEDLGKMGISPEEKFVQNQKKEEEKIARGRKGKTLGARKNWIPVR